MKFSMIMSTLGRREEVLHFLRSLELIRDIQFELIIVDQNETDDLFRICQAVTSTFPVRYMREPAMKGLSRGRNAGIALATGDILCFPDDDCIYPAGLLRDVLLVFENTGADIVCGRAANEKGESINGRFEKIPQWIDRNNVFTTQIEWVVFFKKAVLEKINGYDEEVGVGASTPWQSCEGPEITIRALEEGFRGYYDPGIFAHHANLHSDRPDKNARRKSRRYARGMGYVMRKHRYSFVFLVKFIVRSIGGACFSLLKLRMRRALYYFNTALGRFEGFAGFIVGYR